MMEKQWDPPVNPGESSQPIQSDTASENREAPQGPDIPVDPQARVKVEARVRQEIPGKPPRPNQGRHPGAAPPAGGTYRIPVPRRDPYWEERDRQSWRLALGMGILYCVTVLLSVTVFTAGMVFLGMGIASLSRSSQEQSIQPQLQQPQQGQEEEPPSYDGFWAPEYGASPFQQQGPWANTLPGEHQEESHTGIQFLISGLQSSTGEQLDGEDNGNTYLVVTITATNMDMQAQEFSLSQLVLRGGEGQAYAPVFPPYSYNMGLLPDQVTLQSHYSVQGSLVFQAPLDQQLTLEIYEADGCLKQTIPLPEAGK